MSTVASDLATPGRSGRLRTFVTWSLIIHAGAGIAWGLPAYLRQHAELELDRQQKAWADNLAKQTAKAAEHAAEVRTELTRRQVDAQLREQFAKLTASLPEARRAQLWRELEPRLAASERAFAAALARPEVSEQDLRNLEAQLQRELVERLDERLSADSAGDLATNFLDQVESAMAPDLARWMQDQVRERVARQLREQADRLVREQREAFEREREAGARALREAGNRTSEADATARRDRDNAHASQDRLGEAAQRLQQAARELAGAAERTPDLGEAVQEGIRTASAAVQAAQTAVGLAKEAAATAEGRIKTADTAAKAATDRAATARRNAEARARKPDEAEARSTAEAAQAAAQAARSAREETAKAATAERTQALEAAERTLAAARQATAGAIEAVGRVGNRETAVRAELRAAAESSLKTATEQALAEELRSQTLPRLTPRLAQAFREKLQQNGLDDARLVQAVATQAAELLAAKVPELAKAGDQVQERFKDLAPTTATPAAQTRAPAGDLERKLAEGQARLAAEVRSRVAAVAKDGQHDGEALKHLGGAGAAEAPGLDLRERIGRLAEGMRNGRVGGFDNGALGSLRQRALERGVLLHDPRLVEDPEAYRRAAAAIAERGRVQGEGWQVGGAAGETSRASAHGPQPAHAVGADNAAATAVASNTHPYQPAFKSLAFAAIPCLAGDAAIDGQAGKWKGVPAVALKPEFGGDRSEQLMQLGWRSDGLYARFTVRDPDRRIAKAGVNDFWRADTVEVWVDCLNAKEKFRARHAGQQFWIWPEGSKDDASLTGGESVIEKRGGWYVPRAFHAAELQRHATRTAEGYVVEFRLPAERMPDADLAPGRIIGFNAYLSTMAGTDWYWSAGKQAGTYAQPDTWGDLLLAGSDATLELDGPGRGGGKPALLVPGQPIALRVVDGDMDLSPTRRDKVMVTLRPAHGGQQIAVLEETGAATGIFAGAVSTVLAIGDDQPGALPVYEGERVDACYLDQARANGARNAEVRLPLRFGAAVVQRLAAQR
jgi:hypothetical protein